MFKLFSKKKFNSSSSVIAKALLEEFILNKDHFKQDLEISDDILPSFKKKIILYQKALTLIALVNKEGENQKFKKVKENFELLIFPDTQEKEMQNFTNIKDAMLHLKELLFNKERKQFSWAISWLSEIGIPETNPAN